MRGVRFVRGVVFWITEAGVRGVFAMYQQYEVLESRRLLSAALSSTGILRVNGETGKDNTITVNLNDAKDHVIVTVNGNVQGTFAVSKVKQIRVAGADGKDNISVTADSALTARTVLFGEGGNDTLRSGAGPSALWGGDG